MKSTASKVQFGIVLIGAIAVAVMILYPPWIGSYDRNNYRGSSPIGYYPLYDPPPTNGDYLVKYVSWSDYYKG